MTLLTITSKKSPVQSEGQDVHRDMKSLANDVPARFSVKLVVGLEPTACSLRMSCSTN